MGMKFHVRADSLGESDEAEVLDDEGIHSGRGGQTEESFRLGQFGGEDKNIHGEVATATAGIEVVHDFWEVLFREVFRPESGVKGGQSEVNGIRPGRDRGLQAVPIPRWGEQFRLTAHHEKNTSIPS